MVRVRIKLVEEPLLQTTFPNSNHSESYFTLAKSTRRRWRLCCSPKLIPQIWLQFFFFCENRQAINTSTRWNDKIFSSIENLISSNAFTIPSNLNSETMKQYKGLTIEIILACKLSKIISAHLVNDFCSIESLWLLSSSTLHSHNCCMSMNRNTCAGTELFTRTRSAVYLKSGLPSVEL